MAEAVALEFIRPPLDLLAPDPRVERSATGKFEDEADLVSSLGPRAAVEKDDVLVSEAVAPVWWRKQREEGVNLVVSTSHSAHSRL